MMCRSGALVKARGDTNGGTGDTLRTALAEAELEYVEDHTSTAAFVAFPICTAGGLDEDAVRPLHALLWTTTPWTVPANQAIAINSNLAYVIIAIASIPDKRFVIAKDRLAFVEQFFGGADAVTVIASIAAEHLAAATYTGLDGKRSPILEAPFVTNCTGTGLVHMAPAYGSDDFFACRAVGIVERGSLTRLARLCGRHNCEDGTFLMAITRETSLHTCRAAAASFTRTSTAIDIRTTGVQSGP